MLSEKADSLRVRFNTALSRLCTHWDHLRPALRSQSIGFIRSTARALATPNVVTCRVDDDAHKAVRLMEEHQLRRIPIVNDKGQLAGIISQADVATRMEEPEKTAEVVKEISQAA